MNSKKLKIVTQSINKRNYYNYFRICREDMEKVNIRFHDNYTVTYQHKKILQFVPELSIDKNLKVITPNIPLLVSANADFPQLNFQ